MRKKILLVAVGAFLAGFLLALSILFYFLSRYKTPERLNFVFLGESGPEHAGATLTDSIIFVSVSREGTILVSVPRDLWYQPWQTKINSLYYYGQEKGNGFAWTKEILGEILGEKIDRAILVDFAVFQDLVDSVGGVDVYVERSFDDYRYPIAGKEEDLCNEDPEYKCRYEHIRFEKGLIHLDGQQALKFVRSRYAEGEEGTDTARSARQQKVLVALKDKSLAPQIVLSSQKINQFWEIFQRRIRSDLIQEDLVILGRMFLAPKARNFQSFVINDWEKGEGLIYHPAKHSSGQWVLLPKDSSWGEIHQFVDCLIIEADKSVCFLEKKPSPQDF